jgi:hypothetical protein
MWGCSCACVATAVPDPTCIAGFCIILYSYMGHPGSTAVSERFVSCNRRMSAFCRLAYAASWIWFASPLMLRVFRVSTLTIRNSTKKTLLYVAFCHFYSTIVRDLQLCVSFFFGDYSPLC